MKVIRLIAIIFLLLIGVSQIMMIPSFINPDNSEYYGIDDSAVEAYYRRNGIEF